MIYFPFVHYWSITEHFAKRYSVYLMSTLLSESHCLLGNFKCFCRLLIVFKLNFYEKFFQKKKRTKSLSNNWDPDQADVMSGLIWFQAVCKRFSADATSMQRVRAYTVVSQQSHRIVELQRLRRSDHGIAIQKYTIKSFLPVWFNEADRLRLTPVELIILSCHKKTAYMFYSNSV